MTESSPFFRWIILKKRCLKGVHCNSTLYLIFYKEVFLWCLICCESQNCICCKNRPYVQTDQSIWALQCFVLSQGWIDYWEVFDKSPNYHFKHAVCLFTALIARELHCSVVYFSVSSLLPRPTRRNCSGSGGRSDKADMQ